MIELVSTATLKGNNGMDIYNLEKKGFSTQEIIITVNFSYGKKEIKGEILAFGGWYSLEENELNEYIEFIKENNLSIGEI